MKERLNGLDIFSGIAGNSIALEEYVNTIAYCEQDRYAQYVLMSRMSEGKLPNRPIWDDITTLFGTMLPKIDIIVGGFPCQDISCAGNGAGLAGKRSGLFYEVIRLTEEIRPSFVFLENVPAIRTRGLREVIRAFTNIGYDCRWTCVSAAEVGASHLRKRWFLLAHAERDSLRKQSGGAGGESRTEEVQLRNTSEKKYVGNSECSGGGSLSRTEQAGRKEVNDPSWWATEPDVGRVVNGLPSRMDRIKCLGNAVVPAQAKEAFERLIGVNIK